MTRWSAVFLAELLKLWSRGTARIGAVAFAVIGILGPLVLLAAAGSGLTVNDQSVSSTMDISAPNSVLWSLYLRNFFVSHVLLAVLAALSFAGELRDHTLREDLIRPVPRSVVLAAKWAAMCAWSGITLVVQAAGATFLGLLLHPATGQTSLSDVLLGYVASWACEAGFAAFALAVAVVIRSVSGALTTVVLFLLFEWVLSWAPSTLDMFAQAMDPAQVPVWLTLLVDSGPFFPSAAWGAWQEIAAGATPSWQPWVALLVYTTVAAVLADRVFARLDVP